MKKIRWSLVSILLIICMAIGVLSGCGKIADTIPQQGKISVVCTNFSVYDWTKNIIGDNASVDLKLLLDNGVDMHSYQATAADIARISSCDVLIMVGGESEEWLNDACKEAINKDMKVLRLFDVLEEVLLEEEIVEGMQENRWDRHEHEVKTGNGEVDQPEAKDEDHETEIEFDEHVWLSLKNTPKMCESIKNVLCQVDIEHASQYEANYSAYVKELVELDDAYTKMISEARRTTVLFGDRFPFRYLMENYGIEYYAAFPGCSAETEASFYTVTFLARKLDEMGLPVAFIIENSKETTAQTIIDNSLDDSRKILVLNSLQSVTKKELEDGITYVECMRKNLEVLKEGLY